MRRDPHKSGESPALHRQAKTVETVRNAGKMPGFPPKYAGRPDERGRGKRQARKPGADTEKTGTIYRAPTRESKSRAFAVRVTGTPRPKTSG